MGKRGRGRKRAAETEGAAGTTEVKKQKKQDTSEEVFRRRAGELTDVLREELGDFPAELNPEKPRRGAFEVTLVREDGSESLVWTGLKKGPPRKLKFPDPQVVVENIKKEL